MMDEQDDELSYATEGYFGSEEEGQPGHLFLFGAIGYGLGQFAVESIHTHNAEAEGRPLHVHIASEGGSGRVGLGVYDLLRRMSYPVVTHAVGTVESAGLTIYMAGDKRLTGPNSGFIVHQSQGHTGGRAQYHAAMAGELAGMDHAVARILGERCTTGHRTESDWAAYMRGNADSYIPALEAHQLGIVTRIIEPQVQPR